SQTSALAWVLRLSTTQVMPRQPQKWSASLMYTAPDTAGLVFVGGSAARKLWFFYQPLLGHGADLLMQVNDYEPFPPNEVHVHRLILDVKEAVIAVPIVVYTHEEAVFDVLPARNDAV